MTTPPYFYRVFGLTVFSEYELPELETIDPLEKPDLRIILGETPQELEGATVHRPHLQIAPQSLLLRIRSAGGFWVRDGKEIILNPLPDAPPENVRLFLLGSAFGALLYQRGILPIHGSALVHQGQAFILTGVTGAGKSTLAAALVHRGCKLLTDDVAAVTFDDIGTPWVQPAYPQQKLWQDSATALELST
ncbi:MAG TPA: aldolase, partial [Bacillota bacterium]|nr:aldolase [Bacillota bacterium]